MFFGSRVQGLFPTAAHSVEHKFLLFLLQVPSAHFLGRLWPPLFAHTSLFLSFGGGAQFQLVDPIFQGHRGVPSIDVIVNPLAVGFGAQPHVVIDGGHDGFGGGAGPLLRLELLEDGQF